MPHTEHICACCLRVIRGRRARQLLGFFPILTAVNEFDVYPTAAYLKDSCDPDWKGIAEYAHGVRTGVSEK